MTAVPHAFYAVVSVFIVACPCALGLVTPLALTRGIGRAADMHIRIKDSLALERLDKADVVVFDKTGTLTEGQPTVTAWLWAQYQEEDFKRILLATEIELARPAGSSHYRRPARRKHNSRTAGRLRGAERQGDEILLQRYGILGGQP